MAKNKDTLELPIGGGFSPPKRKYVGGIYNEWAGLRDQAVADLTVYLENPVGVGEHANISEEIKKLLIEEKYLDEILLNGLEKADKIASKKVKKIHEIIGF